VFIRIETSSGIPITRQIMDQIRAQCASGALSPHDRMPSVRELARDLAVNQNTILRVYERLTVEGLLERRHGDGTYVAGRLPARRLEQQRGCLEGEIGRLVDRAAVLQVKPDELCRMVREAYAARVGGDSETSRRTTGGGKE
jgi:GntR family transcriptional regulator